MNTIQLRGDWRKLNHIAKKLGDTSDFAKNELIAELAEEVRESVHEVVNSSPPPRNAESTIVRKGFDNPMYETGGFMEDDSIIAQPFLEGRKISYIIKGNPYMTHERSDETYDDILAINSLGGGNVPSRDIFDIAYDRKREEIRRTCIMKLKEHIGGD